jgi:hypothetical protein
MSDDYRPPSSSGSGCLPMLAFLVGVVLLLPGLCAVFFISITFKAALKEGFLGLGGFVALGLLAGVVGVLLIGAAIRSLRS